MDFANLLFIFMGLTYIGALVYLANVVESARLLQTRTSRLHPGPALEITAELAQDRVLRWMIYGLAVMTFVLGLIVLQTAMISTLPLDLDRELEGIPIPEISPAVGLITFVLALLASVITYRAAASDAFRQRLKRLLGDRGAFDPDSRVHVAGVALVMAVSAWSIVGFVLQGGITGFAEQIETTGIDAGDIVFQAVLQVVIALLGVGLAIRRQIPETLDRLGLRMPLPRDLYWGIGLGVGFILLGGVFQVVWQGITSPEEFANQTAAAEQIGAAFSTLPLAFVMAASAALGEEIAIRGALQPVFGIIPTSVFFLILHTQYTLTPATILILVLSLGLGWLRQRYSTTAAIIAHFVFNFVPLALVSLAPGMNLN